MRGCGYERPAGEQQAKDERRKGHLLAGRIDNPRFSGQTPLRTVILPFSPSAVMSPSPSEPDPSKPNLSATGVLRAQPNNPQGNDARFEADFAQLAACFSAQSGGGLSPELCTDLALEIVLNEVVEQACLTTGATGAAIALERDGEMVCRASSGATAPPLGSRIEATSGLSTECICTRHTQHSDDVLADSRVDAEASQRLGIRSVLVMPLLRRDELVGLFELFSSLPNAFGDRDQLTLEALSRRILSNLEHATAPLPSQPESLPLPEINEFLPENLPSVAEENSYPRGFDVVTWALRLAVLVCAVMLGLLLGRHLGTGKPARRHPIAPQATTANPSVAPSPTASAVVTEKQEPAAVAPPFTPAKKSHEPAPPGSLLVFENGKEIFRMSPAPHGAGSKQAEPSATDRSEVRRASSQERETSVAANSVGPSSAAAGTLIHRVEPEYPADARQRNIHGAVVLDVQIGPNGSVQDVKVMSGPPELAQSSIDAVKQWRFKPRLVNGSPVPMQTNVTLNFKLPR
jgi:TonB family protein